MSALGCVARSVLISGSSTGLVPPPRGAPSLASRRRTAAVPAAAALVSPAGVARAGRTPRARLGGAPGGDAASAGDAVSGGDAVPAGDAVSADGGWLAAPGAAAAEATPPSAAGSSCSVWSCCPASARVTSVPAVLAVATSPATYAPHVRRNAHSIGGRSLACPAPGGRSRPLHREQR